MRLLEPGKRPGKHSETSGGCSQPQMNARRMEYMPAVSEAKGPARVAYVRGKVNEYCVEMLLDSGHPVQWCARIMFHNKIWSPFIS